MTNSYTTVDSVLKSVCIKIGDPGERNYVVLLQHAISWFTAEYNAESGQTLKTVLLDVGPDRMAQLPDDYLDYVVVGRRSGDYIRNLSHNPKLCSLPPLEGSEWPLWYLPDDDWPRYEYAGWEGGSLYGYGWGEYREEFTIDPQERTLRLSSLIGPDEPLYFQYVSNDLNPGKPTPLHPAYALALEHWLMWHYHLYKSESGQAQLHKQEYYAARLKALRATVPFSYADLNAIIRQCAYGRIR